MDFVTAWKASSIVLTGAFGVLGLIKNFKNKETGQITGWGKISLAGILLSSGLGVLAQLKESSAQERSRQATAEQTLSLAKKTDQTVRDLQRVLSPLDEPQFTFEFSVSCENPKYRSLCSATSNYNDVPAGFREWPEGIRGEFNLSMSFFADAKDADSFIARGNPRPDLGLSITARVKDKNLFVQGVDKGVLFFIPDYDPFKNAPVSRPYSNRKIKSALDLSGATLVIGSGTAPLGDLRLEQFYFRLKTGQEIDIDPALCKTISVRGAPAYRYVFP